MADYPIAAGVHEPLDLGFFYREVAGPAPDVIPPDPLADEVPPAMYYVGGRAGLWVPPLLCGNSPSTLTGFQVGTLAWTPGVTPVGPRLHFGHSESAPLVIFDRPTGCTDSQSPLDLGIYGAGMPFRVINTPYSAGQAYYQFRLTEPTRLRLRCTLLSGITGVAVGWSLGFAYSDIWSGVTDFQYMAGNYSSYTQDFSSVSTTSWFEKEFPPGLIRLRVIRYGVDYDYADWASGGTYTIDVEPIPAQSSYPQTSRTSAYHLGELNAGQSLTISSQFAANQSEHWYKACSNLYSTNFGAMLTGLQANLDFEVWCSSQKRGSSANSGTTSESIAPVTIDTGMFDVRITNPTGSTSPYTLTITAPG